MDNISSSRWATAWRNFDPNPPADFNPTEHPILARHWFGLDLSDGRQIFWNQARLGNRLPAECDVILLDGGQR